MRNQAKMEQLIRWGNFITALILWADDNPATFFALLADADRAVRVAMEGAEGKKP